MIQAYGWRVFVYNARDGLYTKKFNKNKVLAFSAC